MEKEVSKDLPENARPAADLDRLAARLVRERNPRRSARKTRRWLLLGAVLALAVLGFLAWRTLRSVPVDVAVVAFQRTGAAAHPILRLSGFVTYPRIVTVAATARTPVERLGFEEGQRVQRGAVLATFRNDELAAQQRTQEIVLHDAQATLTRVENLKAAGAASEADLQRAQTAVAAAQANLDLLQAQRANTVVRAPFAGLVTQKLVEVGEVAAQGVCRLIDDATTLVQVDVNQEDIARIGPQQPAVVTLDAYAELEYAARIYQVAPTADQARNTVTVKVQVLAPDARFLPQLSAKVYFVEQPQAANAPVSAVLAVDKSAVVTEQGQTYVWRIRDGKAARQEVETGEDLGDQIEITAGLQVDEQVVAKAAQYQLKDGARVAPRQGS